ncbi:MAG: protease family protein [Verrucomicrobiota bacterium]|jgi:CAAX prenyl protease-like protein
MDSAQPRSDIRKLIAFTLPMAVFLTLLGMTSAGSRPETVSWFAYPAYWIFPVQTALCGALVLWFWRDYEFRAPGQVWFAAGIGVLVFVIWIAPQQFFGFSPRVIGFDPEVFGRGSTLYWATVLLRFLRLVVVVPLVEEIFWRGFLLRYLVNERFTTIPVGAFSWLSFVAVTLAFGFTHSRPDWIAAFICGALYNAVAYRTGSLASCVIAHGLTNLLLGLWIMQTRQWGFW